MIANRKGDGSNKYLNETLHLRLQVIYTYSGILKVTAGHPSYVITAVVACNAYGVSCLVATFIPGWTLNTATKYITSATSVPIRATNAAYISKKKH